MVYLIKTDRDNKEIDKYTDRALLVMLTLGLCVYMNTTITNPSKCAVCFVYKWACMHKVYTSSTPFSLQVHNKIHY